MMKRLRIRLFCHHADLFSAFCGEFSPAFERVFLVRRSSSIALRQFPFLPRRRPPTIVRLRFLVASMSGKPGEGDGSPGKKEASPSSNTKSDDEDIGKHGLHWRKLECKSGGGPTPIGSHPSPLW